MTTRQPLLDGAGRVLAYEIRSEVPAVPATVAALAAGRRAFVRVTAEALLTGDVGHLPASQTVLMLPGAIDPAPDVRGACDHLRRRGYQIALDRFVPGDEVSPLVRYVDFLTTGVDGIRAVIDRPVASVRPTRPPAVVAVNVDTRDEFDSARATGCSAFQGDFITRPARTATSQIPATHVTRLRVMRALQDPDLSVAALEELIKPDAALCLRVMRAVNGAAFGQLRRIESLRQALLLVGTGTVRDWTTVWTMSEFSRQAPEALVAMASVRGRFCELLSRAAIASTGGDGFLLGLCSLLDAILQSPMNEVLKHVPLCASNEAALLGQSNGQRALLDAVVAYEHGEWETSRTLAAGVGIDPSMLPGAYRAAVDWMTGLERLAA